MTDFQTQARAAEAAMRDVFPVTPLQKNVLLSERFALTSILNAKI